MYERGERASLVISFRGLLSPSLFGIIDLWRIMKQSDEMKVAHKIAGLITDLRLDLELVGHYLAHYTHRAVIRRLSLIAEVAEEEKNGTDITHHDY